MRLKWFTRAAGLVVVLLPLFSTGQETSASFDDVVSRASAAREHNDVPMAIELYSQALQLNPKWPDGWWFLGSLQYGAGAYAQATDSLSHYLDLTPNAAPALALRGLCEFETGEYQQSLADIQGGIALGAANQPRNEQILRYHEALLLTRLSRFGEALKAYGVFAQQGVTNSELLVAIGLAGLRMPLLPKDINPDQQNLVAAAGSAAFQFMAGDENGAQQAFQDLFQHFPAAANTHYLYAYLLFATDPDEALPEFKRESEIAPANTNALVMTAWALLMRNRPAEALPYAQKAAAQNPDLPAAQLALGRSLMDTGDINGGLERLEKALQLEPDNLETHIALAKAYSKSGREADARRERELCLQLTTSDPGQIARP